MTDKTKNSAKKQSGLSGLYLEASRSPHGMTVLLSGVVGIKDFSETLVTLGAHSGKIKVCGQRLRVNLYEGGNLEVSGRIEEIKFEYGKA